MEINAKKAFETLNPRKVWIPVAIGLAIVVYLFWSDPDMTVSDISNILNAKLLPLLLAVLVLVARDFGYMYRIRALTNHEIEWGSAFYVIILWEFASAVTPSVVGGTAVAVFILMMERMSFGRSLSFVMLTAIFDNLYFLTVAPLVIFFTAGNIFPELTQSFTVFGFDFNVDKGLENLFWISFSLILLYTCIMSYALFFRPRAFKWILLKITSIKFLRKFRHAAGKNGDDIILASRQLKGKDWKYWMKILVSTYFIWTARYLMLNCIIASFTSVSFVEHLDILGKEVIMWVIMLISPTPGSSGTAEVSFDLFYSGYLGTNTLGTAILWRLFTYYFYLLLGVIFLPRWIRRIYKRGEKSKDMEAIKEEINA
ncbi:lysylphosphatidylglycerol synthase transmembrane domain-containing protein [Marinigracilibium pacificum]|uniref:Flippase-like domain-containing protein n=1 Tax=Marinigracilibium pacificum TaxID=2729599 RepID=A0A848IW80_9BACT|nr:lysylphosphatidylglycerol synthase transmembrane domain-containing protein [Marinigracilibium pacificum]NMM47418.1 flippase-like domain-containing protein [Marinigracilibium pacificum]